MNWGPIALCLTLLFAGTLPCLAPAAAQAQTARTSPAATDSTPSANNAAPSKGKDVSPSSESKPSQKTSESVDLSAIPKDTVITVDDLYEMLGGAKLDKIAKEAAAKEANPAPPENLAIVDIRNLATYSKLHVQGAICVPAGKVFEIRLREVPRDKTVILIDKDGSRLVETWETLIANDYDPEKILVVEGGTDAWFAAEYPTVVSPLRQDC